MKNTKRPRLAYTLLTGLAFLPFTANLYPVEAELVSPCEEECVFEFVRAERVVTEEAKSPDRTSVATQSAKIPDFIVKTFGPDAQKAYLVLRGDGVGFKYSGKTYCRTGENSGLKTDVINVNRNGSWDVGLWQINVPNPEQNMDEVERLKDPDYNTQRAYKKYLSGNKTFYHWTCGTVVGDYTYLDKLRGL